MEAGGGETTTRGLGGFTLEEVCFLSAGVKSDVFVKATTPKQMIERTGVTTSQRVKSLFF